MIGTLLSGPFLTRAEAAARGSIDAMALASRQDVLRLPGHHLEETYPAFQFDRAGLRPDVASIVGALAPDWDQLSIADWLVRPSPDLSALSPLAWLQAGRSPQAVLDAAQRHHRWHHTPTVPASTAAALTEARVPRRTAHRRAIGGPAPAT